MGSRKRVCANLILNMRHLIALSFFVSFTLFLGLAVGLGGAKRRNATKKRQ